MGPKKFSDFKEGEWQGKVLIRDKKTKKSGIVNLKIKAVDGEKLRIDATSTLGTHLASILLVGSDLEYLHVADKTLYKSAANKDSLRKLLHVPLEPNVLYNILFDHGIANKSWACSSDAKGFLNNCSERKSGLKIEWNHRQGLKRIVEIEHRDATLQMNLYSFERTIADPEKAFQLKTPNSFKVRKM